MLLPQHHTSQTDVTTHTCAAPHVICVAAPGQLAFTATTGLVLSTAPSLPVQMEAWQSMLLQAKQF